MTTAITLTLADILARGLKEEIVVLTNDFLVAAVNDTFRETYEGDAERIIGEPCYLILHACKICCQESMSGCPLREAITTGEKASATILDVPAKSAGQNRHFLVEVFPVAPGDEGGATCFLHITRDITESVENERLKEKMWIEILGRLEKIYGTMITGSEEIASCNQELENLNETIPLALVRWDREGRIVSCNSSAVLLLGWSTQEIVGKPFSSLFTSGSAQESFIKSRRAILGNSVEYVVCENRTASGRILMCEWYHSAAHDKDGKISGGLSIGQDVTEQTNTLKALKISRAQMHALLGAANDAIIGVNNLGRIALWSLAAERLFGWKEKEVLGKEPGILMPAAMRAEHREWMHQFFTSANTGDYPGRSFETMALGRAGNIIPVRITLTAADIDGKPAVYAAIQNLTDRKRMEKILLQSEKKKELGEMTKGIVHDLNNTLAAILASTQICKRTTKDTAILEYLGTIETAAGIGSKKVTALMDTQDEIHLPEKGFTSMALEKLIEDVLEFTSFRWKDQMQNDGYSINITTDHGETPPVLVMVSDFREMLTNIIFNAIDSLPQGGKIHFATKVEDHKIVLTCEDNGEGIEPDALDRIFEPFFTTKDVGHAGLGLTIARSIAARHSGRITVRSTKGVGTAVTLHFPLAVTTEIPKAGLLLPVQAKMRHKILVIDDEPLIRDVLARILRAAGHEAICAADGKEGMQLFREENFDLVISDLGMPVMGGIDVATRVKRLKPSVPVIIITGWGITTDQVRQRLGSADEILAKPFDIDTVLAVVHRLCDVAKPESKELE